MIGAVLQNAAPVAAHAASPAIHAPQIKYLGIMPVLVMLGGAVVLLAVTSLLRRPLRTTAATAGTLLVSLASLAFALWQWYDLGPAYTTVDRAVVVDGFSVFVAVLVSCAMVLSTLVGDGYLRREGAEGPEYHVLALISASGAILMAQANDLIVIFLGLEILSIALYVLAAFNTRRTASGEAALKYFVLGAFSSAIFVYGIALTYGATGSSNLTQIADFLSKNVLVSDGVLLAGLGLLLVGFGFKIAAVPFHMWTPDVYQGSPSPVTGFMAAVAKVGGFAALLRVFISTFGVERSDWRPIVYVLALLSLVVGAVLALVQRDVKRMMAYSSINHAGFILLGLVAATTQGVESSLYYLFAYTFMVIGTFALITVLGGRGDRAHDIAGYRGLASRQPVVALALAVLLLAQAGAPFTTGLWAKLQVVAAAVDAGAVPLAVVAMVTAAIAAFFYLRLAVLMYTPQPAADGGGAPVPAGEAGAAGSVVGPGAGAGAPVHTVPVNMVPADPSGAVAVITRLNAEIVLEGAGPEREPDGDGADGADGAGAGAAAETAEATEAAEAVAATEAAEAADPDAGLPAVVRVPVLTRVAVGLSLLVTVWFGVFPAPLIDFAHQATLLFFPS